MNIYSCFLFGFMPKHKKKIDACLHCSIRSLFDVVVRSLSFLSARQQIAYPLSLSLVPTHSLVGPRPLSVILCLLNIRPNEQRRERKRQKASFEYNEYAVGRARLRVMLLSSDSTSLCLY